MQDPRKNIFNFSKYELFDCEKRLLAKGLNFSLPPDYLVNFELFYRNIRNLSILSNEDRDCNWTRTHNHLVRKRTLNHLTKLAKVIL